MAKEDGGGRLVLHVDPVASRLVPQLLYPAIAADCAELVLQSFAVTGSLGATRLGLIARRGTGIWGRVPLIIPPMHIDEIS